MPAYRAYPTVKDTPNRKMRKAQRKSVFADNKYMANAERKARRIARKAANV